MVNNESIGDRIIRFRSSLKLTQQHVASEVGVSRVAVTKWESGDTHNMKLPNLIGLSNLFHITIDELVTGSASSKVQQKVAPYNLKAKPKHPAIASVTTLMEKMDDERKWRLSERAQVLLEEQQLKAKANKAG